MSGGVGGSGTDGTGGKGGVGYDAENGQSGTGNSGGGGGGTGGGLGGAGGSGAGGDGGQGGEHGFIGATLANSVPLAGERGVDGGSPRIVSNDPGGGGGGAGGYGAVVTTAGANSNTSTITGGNGGNGGTAVNKGGINAQYGGDGGDGGIGVFFAQAGASLANSNMITGGDGGYGGLGLVQPGNGGTGGAGVAGADLTIVNTGFIVGGSLATNVNVRADAIDFTGGDANSLTLGDGERTGTLSGGIGVGGTLTIAPGTVAGASATLANQIHDYAGTAGNVRKAGDGKLTLTEDNTYTGTTTVSAGTLQIGDGGTTGSIAASSDVSVASGATLALDRSGQFAFGNTVSGQGTLTVRGATAEGDAVTLSGALTQTGGLTVTDASNVTIAATSSYVADGNGIALNGGQFTNQGAVTVTGANADNAILTSRTEATTVVNAKGAQIEGQNSGIIQLYGSESGATDSGTLTVDNAGLIQGNNYDSVTQHGTGALNVTNAGTGVIYGKNASGSENGYGVGSDGGGTLTLTNATGGKIVGQYGALGSNAADNVVNAGTIASGSYDRKSGAITVGGTDAIQLRQGGTVVNQAGGTIEGALHGVDSAGTLTLSNAGTITSTGNDTVFASTNGATILNAGTGAISASATSAIVGSAGLSVTNAAGGTLSGGTDGTYGYAVQFAGNSGTFNNYGTATGSAGGVLANANIANGPGVDVALFAGSTTGSIVLGDATNTVTVYTGIVDATAETALDSITDDTVTLRAAGTFDAASVGDINLGKGASTLNLRGTGDGTETNGGAGFIGGIVSGSGAVDKQDSGTFVLAGANTYTGGTTIRSGNLVLDAATTLNEDGTVQSAAAGTGAITFPTLTGTATARLTLELNAQPTNTTFANTIANFGTGSELDLTGLTNASVSYNSSNSQLTVTGTRAVNVQVLRVATAADEASIPQETVSQTFQLSNPTSTNFTAQDDGNGGTLIMVCYCSGTQIRTIRGDVAVEDLHVGDVAVTASGAQRPIRWIGSRTVDCARYPHPSEVMPVRVSAGALGENRPARDLVVSPGHGLGLDVLGEVLIPAASLINGTTIRQEIVETATYWHVELDSHDILIAEGQPAESYLDMGNRGFFAKSDVVDLRATPDANAAARTHADFCRPYVADGVVLDAVRAQIQARAERLGWRLDDASWSDMHLMVDGVRIEADTHGFAARFVLPAAAQDVWLVSDTSVPSLISNNRDSRRLGLCIAAISIDDGVSDKRTVALDDPRLSLGFHDCEDGVRRWTMGRSALPAELFAGCRGTVFLRLDLAGPALPRWAAPEAAVVGETAHSASRPSLVA